MGKNCQECGAYVALDEQDLDDAHEALVERIRTLEAEVAAVAKQFVDMKAYADHLEIVHTERIRTLEANFDDMTRLAGKREQERDAAQARVRELEAELVILNERQRQEWSRAETAEAERDAWIAALRLYAPEDEVQQIAESLSQTIAPRSQR